MESRRLVSELTDQEAVDQVFLVSNKQLRPNRNGDLYLLVDLSDRSGMLSARLWNADEALYRSFENNDFVRVRGTAQVYQGAMQMIATHITKVRNPDINEEDFFPLTPQKTDQLTVRLNELMRAIKDPHLSSLAECFLMDEKLMAKFTKAPAGIKNHHAYHGGLLEHVVTIMEVAARIADCYPDLDAELLRMGIFLHDLGKIDELAYEKSFSYTDEGQLIGHLVMCISILEAKVREAERLSSEPIPNETVLRLKHMIVSHHGEYEFGSPKLPMTPEAIALNFLDNLDAKLHHFRQLIHDDPSVDDTFTMYQPNLRRKLYKGKRQ